MKFIVDAQLPRKVAKWLTEAGYDCIHTLYLPAQNATQDREL
jgi:predicted nuclease of predicted toxin-antitoxin system